MSGQWDCNIGTWFAVAMSQDDGSRNFIVIEPHISRFGLQSASQGSLFFRARSKHSVLIFSGSSFLGAPTLL